MLTKEICADCGKVFLGGPKANLCLDCRKERARQQAKKIKLSELGRETYRKNGKKAKRGVDKND